MRIIKFDLFLILVNAWILPFLLSIFLKRTEIVVSEEFEPGLGEWRIRFQASRVEHFKSDRPFFQEIRVTFHTLREEAIYIIVSFEQFT